MMDKTMKDGSIFRDRARAYVYVDLYEVDSYHFSFDANEVTSLVLVNAEETMQLLEQEQGFIEGKEIVMKNGVCEIMERKIDFSEFLVNEHETALEKYGDVLKKVISLTK